MTDADLKPTRDSFVARVKSLAGLITSVAALAVATGSLIRTPEEKGARSAYGELSIAVRELSESVAKQHDDLVAVRAYVAGRDGSPIPTAPASTATPIASGSSPSTHPWPRPTATAHVALMASAVPSIGPRPPVFMPKGFQK